jgi:hypothetical protein
VTINAVMADTTEAPDDRPNTRTTEAVHKTDAAGRIEVSYSADDPDSDNKNQDEITLTLTITVEDAPELKIKATDGDADTDDIQAIWSDDDSEAETLALAQAVKYHETDDDGVRNTVTATLVDQYGDPIKNKKVALWSDADNSGDFIEGLGGTTAEPGDNRTTSRSGVATKSYSRELLPGFSEMINAAYVVGCHDDAAQTPADEACDDDTSEDSPGIQREDDDIDAEAITHYWAVRIAPEGTNPTVEVTSATVLVADTDNNTVVVMTSGGDPQLATYKGGSEGDHFQLSGDAIKIEAFEKMLDDGDVLDITIGNDEDDINVFNITTDN